MENIEKKSSFKHSKKDVVIKSFNLIGKEENLGIISKIIDKKTIDNEEHKKKLK